ncbi:lysis protein [Xenorhabdus nematophila]|uniref:Lysis protein n=1 Tax=Xenorhabdus ehlersii TaxID=290111 RepID=A0A2D0ILA3_9GAMM|nr:lysis protein [Xenorhabdus ehlersii]PHM22548.1 lysis protein [Xenorhabdus ehlersii]RKE91424.1 prophage endopeptidase [Xenorhabdus ehlersii]
MKFTLTGYTMIALAVVAGINSFGSYYYSNQYAKQKHANERQASEIQQLTDTIHIQNTHIDMLQELDTKHTEKLAYAQSEIDRLHADSVVHPERVYIQAKCPVPKTVAATRVDDATPARPTDTAIRNYWLLRQRIATSEQMILGLQDYIKTQCQ